MFNKFKKRKLSDYNVTHYPSSIVKKWTGFYELSSIDLRYHQEIDIENTLGRWQAFINYLVEGGEAYVLYNEGSMKGSAGKITYCLDETDIKKAIGDEYWNTDKVSSMFKIVFDHTTSTDKFKISGGIYGTQRCSSYWISFTTDPQEHCYLTTSSYYKKTIAKSNIVYDRYGVQITEGCYVLAAVPGTPPAIEAGKITHITDAGIIWFQKLGQEYIMKGILRSKSCVVITPNLSDNILMEKLSI